MSLEAIAHRGLSPPLNGCHPEPGRPFLANGGEGSAFSVTRCGTRIVQSLPPAKMSVYDVPGRPHIQGIIY